MKIVNREQFLVLPSNTLFSKYQPVVFGDLQIKGVTTKSGEDYWYQPITDAVDASSGDEMISILEAAEETGESFNVDLECESRDGLFDTDQLFVIWEKPDIEKLINRLKDCL